MPESWTISSVRDALAAKKLSARELAADFFKRIDAQNPTLNAYLTLSPERAYAQADKIDALIAANKPLPPLAGVPVGIKDVLSTRGIRTTCASKILENHYPAYDATAVEAPSIRRRRPPRQNQLRRIRHGQLQRKLRLRPREKSPRARPRPRRLQRRLRSRRCC